MTDTVAAAADKPYNRRFTREVENVAVGVGASSSDFDPALLEFEQTGDFFGLLAQQDYSLFVTREYEHFLLALDGCDGAPVQSPFPLPHPSGFTWDAEARELVVSSTRTPNLLVWLTPFRESAAGAEIRPADVAPPPPTETVFLPRTSRYLPGSLYIHDLVKMQGELYATITGHNFLAKLSLEDGFERVWHPAALDGLGERAFNENYFQLNSIAANGSPEESFYTGFSDETSGAKPWKAGYGPDGKGVVFSGRTREPLLRGLTCPHAAKLHGGKLWLCNSGYGSVGYVEGFECHDPDRARYVEVAKAPGFTRGLCFAGDYMFVGLSKVIKQYEPYAPGLKPEATKCGVWVFDWRTGDLVASLSWPQGYQLYDVQIVEGVKNPRLPLAKRASDGINPLLRFLA